jgi:hypothetical protein
MATPTLLEQLTGVGFSDPVQAAILGGAFAAVIIAGQAAFKISRALRCAAAERRRRADRRPLRADMVSTMIGAGLVLALSVEGMWRFFGAIGMPPLARIAFAAVFEICLLAVALRARHIRLLRQARREALLDERDRATDGTAEAARLDARIRGIRLRGLNDLLVWVLAAVIGLLAALEAPNQEEQVFRFLVPFVAATMWELALGADVEDQRVTTVARTWGTKARAAAGAVGRACVSVAIFFGWQPPTSANASTKFREKLMTRLVAVCHEIHTAADEAKAKLLERQRELILDLQARGQWNAGTLAELQERLDMLYRAVELTAPTAVRPRMEAKPQPAVLPTPIEAAPAATLMPVLAELPADAPTRKPRRRRAATLDAALAAAYKRLYIELGAAPSVTKLGEVGPWSRSKAGAWMQKNRVLLAVLEADALAEAHTELEGASA